ncbi:tetrapyrrole biosynthesis, uroporphyrinogen III synthase [Dichotomocladium elegans]|nr:tetrapyrrole biosynthesis, uroporphyrinogen III synthase [Dichotomocladium elegans]
MSRHVILFRAEATDCPDEYRTLFTQQGYTIAFIPVLSFAYESIDYLISLLASPPCHGGIIFTSQHAVEAWSLALERTNRLAIHPLWHTRTLYIVGSKTAEKLKSLGFFHDDPNWRVASRAAELAHIILSQTPRPASLLFFAGDKRRDELPTKMTSAGIEIEEIRVYRTCEHPDLREKLQSLPNTGWLVLFSPSGVDYILRHRPFPSGTRLAAIGPTTADHLERNRYVVDAVASAPRANSVVKCIQACDNEDLLKHDHNKE